MTEPVVIPRASDLRLHSGMDDGTAVMIMDLLDADGEVIAHFHLNLSTAESVCLSLAVWYRLHSPGQTAPTSTSLQ